EGTGVEGPGTLREDVGGADGLSGAVGGERANIDALMTGAQHDVLAHLADDKGLVPFVRSVGAVPDDVDLQVGENVRVDDGGFDVDLTGAGVVGAGPRGGQGAQATLVT